MVADMGPRHTTMLVARSADQGSLEQWAAVVRFAL